MTTIKRDFTPISKEKEFHQALKEMRTSYLRFSLTNDCNANCGFCHNDGQKGGIKGLKAKKRMAMLPEEEIKNIADYFKDSFRDVKFTGGEPTLVSNLASIVKIFDERGYNCSMVSNGFLLDRDLQLQLKDNGLKRINVSLPSLRQNIYSELFGVKQDISKTLENISSMSVIYKDNVKINFMASDLNVPQELESFNQISAKYDIKISCMDLIQPKSMERYMSQKVIDELTHREGEPSIILQPSKTYEKKIFTFPNGGKWEIDDFREATNRKVFDNKYCNNCGVKEKCVEGPYALRVGYNGTLKPCLIRNDNKITFSGGKFDFEGFK